MTDYSLDVRDEILGTKRDILLQMILGIIHNSAQHKP
jgi:hypothetical protein